MKSRSVWFENGTEKARKQRNENSKRLIKSAILGNADIFVVRKSYKTQKSTRFSRSCAFLLLNNFIDRIYIGEKYADGSAHKDD